MWNYRKVHAPHVVRNWVGDVTTTWTRQHDVSVMFALRRVYYYGIPSMTILPYPCKPTSFPVITTSPRSAYITNYRARHRSDMGCRLSNALSDAAACHHSNAVKSRPGQWKLVSQALYCIVESLEGFPSALVCIHGVILSFISMGMITGSAAEGSFSGTWKHDVHRKDLRMPVFNSCCNFPSCKIISLQQAFYPKAVQLSLAS